MKRNILIVILLIILSLLPVLSEGEIYAVENLDAINISNGWQYFPNVMLTTNEIAPHTVGQKINLYHLSNELFSINLKRQKGTLYKVIELPPRLVGQELALYNDAFQENVSIYVNGENILQQGSFSLQGESGSMNLYQSTRHFVPDKPQLEFLIQVDQTQSYLSSKNDLYIGGTKSIARMFYLNTFGEYIKIGLWLVLTLLSIPQFKKRNEILFNFLLSASLLIRIITTKESIISQFTFLPISFVVKLSILSHIFIHVFILLSIFSDKKDWTIRSDLGIIGYNFLSVFTLLLLNRVNLILWVYANFIVMTFIYIINWKSFRRRIGTHYFMALIVFYLFDFIYQLTPWFNQIYLVAFMSFALFIVGRKTFLPYTDFKGDKQEGQDYNQQVDLSLSEQALIAKSVLANMNEGYISINESLLVNHFCSDAALNMLGKGAKYKKITETLFGNDIQQKVYVEGILNKFFFTHKWNEKHIYLDLLPNEITLNGRHLSLDYKVTEDKNNLIILLEDRSEQIGLITETNKEREKLHMIIEVMRHQNHFYELKHQYDKFINDNIQTYFNVSGDISSLLGMWLSKLHYFKLQFDGLGLVSSVRQLEVIESEILELRNNAQLLTPQALRAIIEDYELDRLMMTDLLILNDYLPEKLNRVEGLFVDRKTLDRIEKQIKVLEDSKEKQDLLDQFWSIRHVYLSKIIENYQQHLKDFAQSLGKKIQPLAIEGEDLLINEDYYGELIGQLTALFNNALEHGIELPSERYRNNKKEAGQISISVKRLDEILSVTFEDDGKGINIESLKKNICQVNHLAMNELDKYSNHEILQFIFDEGITSVENAVNFGQKGMGLSRLRKTVLDYGGMIEVNSTWGQGTTFYLEIPDIDS